MAVVHQACYQHETEAIRRGFLYVLDRAVSTLGATAPNPSVGCVLLDRQGQIVSVGVHEAVGQPHAEAIALQKAQEAGVVERIYSALVTLEPCAHHGRTPPCSELLRHSPVQQIWIGARDPNPVAAGGGKALRQGEHAKKVFFLDEYPAYEDIAQKCRALLAPFFHRVVKGRPWITVKQALNRSGTMIPPQGMTTFTAPSSLKFAHQLRRVTDAIVTGIGTVLADNPSFTVRHVPDHIGGKSRLLVVMDRQHRMPIAWKQARERDGFVVHCCASLDELWDVLKIHGVNWVLVEAGPTLLRALNENGLWDDWLTITQLNMGQNDRLTWRVRGTIQENDSPLSLLECGEK